MGLVQSVEDFKQKIKRRKERKKKKKQIGLFLRKGDCTIAPSLPLRRSWPQMATPTPTLAGRRTLQISQWLAPQMIAWGNSLRYACTCLCILLARFLCRTVTKAKVSRGNQPSPLVPGHSPRWGRGTLGRNATQCHAQGSCGDRSPRAFRIMGSRLDAWTVLGPCFHRE